MALKSRTYQGVFGGSYPASPVASSTSQQGPDGTTSLRSVSFWFYVVVAEILDPHYAANHSRWPEL